MNNRPRPPTATAPPSLPTATASAPPPLPTAAASAPPSWKERQKIPEAITRIRSSLKSRRSQKKWVTSFLTGIIQSVVDRNYPRDLLQNISSDLEDPFKDVESQPQAVWKPEKIQEEYLLFVPTCTSKAVDICPGTYIQQLSALIIGTMLTGELPFANKRRVWTWRYWIESNPPQNFISKCATLARGQGASASDLLKALWDDLPATKKSKTPKITKIDFPPLQNSVSWSETFKFLDDIPKGYDISDDPFGELVFLSAMLSKNLALYISNDLSGGTLIYHSPQLGYRFSNLAVWSLHSLS